MNYRNLVLRNSDVFGSTHQQRLMIINLSAHKREKMVAKLSESVGSLKMRVPLIEVIQSIVVLVRGGSENA